MLIAYENGFIILWDVTEDRAVLVRGYKDLQRKDEIVIDSLNDVRREHINVTSDNEQAEKEISSLCWVSSDGSILAVGYVDGDILLWNLSTAASTKDQKGHESSSNVIKLQLSSAEKRLPVIVLHWYSNSAHKGPRGQLFVYGGDEIGSEEVLTVCSRCAIGYGYSLRTLLPLKISILLHNFSTPTPDVLLPVLQFKPVRSGIHC